MTSRRDIYIDRRVTQTVNQSDCGVRRWTPSVKTTLTWALVDAELSRLRLWRRRRSGTCCPSGPGVRTNADAGVRDRCRTVSVSPRDRLDRTGQPIGERERIVPADRRHRRPSPGRGAAGGVLVYGARARRQLKRTAGPETMIAPGRPPEYRIGPAAFHASSVH